jgi:hypothetical protein
MSAPHSPPPGSVPSGMMSPDMQSTLAQMTNAGSNSADPGAADPFGAAGAGGGSSIPSMPGSSQQKNARPVGSLPQEAKYMAEDIAQGLLSVLPDFMQSMLGVKPTDSPEEAARKRQMLQRYTQLNNEQQQVVQKKLQEEHQKKQIEEQEKAQRQQEEQQKAQSEVVMPQGKTSGEGGPGASNKKRTMTKLQNDRKKLTSAG